METTAEGVETLDELDLVRMHGCSHVQGFIYERALSAEAATERLHTGLAAVAQGPRASRSARQTMLRKIVLDHGGQLYNGTIRNISPTGALIEGLWNVPVGTIFHSPCRTANRDRAPRGGARRTGWGSSSPTPLQLDANGRVSAAAPPPVIRQAAQGSGLRARQGELLSVW